MFAVVKICGKQYRAEQNCSLLLDRLDAEIGSVVEVKGSDVLLTSDGKDMKFGSEASVVKMKIVDHTRGDKKIIYKKRRRKHSESRNGYRHAHTKVLVESIS